MHLVVGEKDPQGEIVRKLYAGQPARYTVYRTDGGVKTWLADDPRLEQLQRRRLLAISALRSQITGLLSDSRREAATEGFWALFARPVRDGDAGWHEQTAFAIIDALEGDGATAAATLARVRDELLAERYSRGRLMYLRVTAAMVMLVAALTLVGSLMVADSPHRPELVNLLRAVAAGALGAFFSIAQSITTRSMRADNRHWDYYVDAITRVAVGCAAALVLEALLDSGLFVITLVEVPLGAGNPGKIGLTQWPVTIVAGFLAGFSEKLIPDLMASYGIEATRVPPAAPAAPAVAGAAGAAAGEEAAAAEELKAKPDDPEGLDVPSTPGEDDALDCCDFGGDASFVPTADEELPAASGGVR